jgi:hypothetical protein
MITNTGKSIIGKYMLGQAPAYASHIAIGSGKQPLFSIDSLSPYQAEFSQKKSLNFEMFRVPIVSRGYVTEPSSIALSIVAAAGSGGLITYETSAVHGYAPGDIVDIAGTNINDYNITNAVVYSAPSPTTFTVQSAATGTYVSGGSVTARITKLTLTAELPTEQRYEITEIGLYSARSNPSATNKDSRMLYTFAETENWEYHGTTSAIGIGSTISTPLSAGVGGGTINPSLGVAPAFRATSDNAIFDSVSRLDRYERCRFLNTAIYVPGNMSQLTMDGTEMVVASSGTEEQNKEFAKHIHLAATQVSISQNSPEDELRMAFSVINKEETYDLDPSRVNLMAVFSPEESNSAVTENFAKFQIEVTEDLDTNRYQIATSKIGELFTGTSFSWGAVSLVRVYASVFNKVNVSTAVIVSNKATVTTQYDHGFEPGSIVNINITGTNSSPFNGEFIITEVTDDTFSFDITYENTTATVLGGDAEAPSNKFFVGLDAVRLENIATLNPLYGLTGYTVIKTDDARPIVKEANTSNLVEFRFGLDVI